MEESIERLCEYLVLRYQPRTAIDIGFGQCVAVDTLRKLKVGAFGITVRPAPESPPSRWVSHHDFRDLLPQLVHQPGLSEEDTVILYSPYKMEMAFAYDLIGTMSQRLQNNLLALFAFFPTVAITHAIRTYNAKVTINIMRGLGFLVDDEATTCSRELVPGSLWADRGLVFIKR